MESDECETHQRFQHMPSSGYFGSHLGGRGEPDGGMLEDDEDLHRLKRHLEGSMEGVEEVGSNFLAKARQGLALLKRSLSGGGQEEAEERAGGGKMDVPIGRKGYGADPSSELEQDMHSKMQEAAKALMNATARIEDDTPHLHAPELYHPEAVTSYEEMEGARWAAGATGALDMERMMKAALLTSPISQSVFVCCFFLWFWGLYFPLLFLASLWWVALFTLCLSPRRRKKPFNPTHPFLCLVHFLYY